MDERYAKLIYTALQAILSELRRSKSGAVKVEPNIQVEVQTKGSDDDMGTLVLSSGNSPSVPLYVDIIGEDEVVVRINGTPVPRPDFQQGTDRDRVPIYWSVGNGDPTPTYGWVDLERLRSVESNLVVFESDFLQGLSPFVSSALNSGTVVPIAGIQGRPGLVQFRSVALVANSGATLNTNTDAFVLEENWRMEAVLRMLATNSRAFVGFHNATTATAPTHGVYFDIQHNGTNLEARGVVVSGGAPTTTAPATLTLNDWYRFVITIPTLNEQRFEIRQGTTTLWQATLNATLTTTPIGLIATVFAPTADTAANLADLDYFGMWRLIPLVR